MGLDKERMADITETPFQRKQRISDHFRGYSFIFASTSLPWGCLGDFAAPCEQETTGNAEESAPEMQRFTFYTISLHQQFSDEVQSPHVLEEWIVQTLFIL